MCAADNAASCSLEMDLDILVTFLYRFYMLLTCGKLVVDSSWHGDVLRAGLARQASRLIPAARESLENFACLKLHRTYGVLNPSLKLNVK